MCLSAGADDVGFVSIDSPALDGDREGILRMFAATRSLICLVCRMSPEPVRSPARSAANLEFHSTGDQVNETAREIVKKLASLGVRALNPPMAFPMEMEDTLGKIWTVSLKPLAVAAGLGHMGLHRNVIHPKFGNFILLGCVLLESEISEWSEPVDYNPCLECKLCVAACPVGAISPQGEFNLSSCYTHNYREFMGGFTDWVEGIADSGSAKDYREKTDDGESASMWQSLSFGANYKAAYCLSVCPAGEDVIGPFLEDRPGFLKDFLKPLQEKTETVYVTPNSDAESYVTKKFPHKAVKRVGSVLRPRSIQAFINTLKHGFQPNCSEGLSAVYHFRFTGLQAAECTIEIKDKKVEVSRGLVGTCDLRVSVDSMAWLKFLRKEVGVARLLFTRKLKLKGQIKLLPAFGKCFP